MRTTMRVLCWLLLSACASPTAPAPLTTGSYPLVRYNGEVLPYDTGPMGPKGQNPGGCPVLISAGRLQIYAASSTFFFQYDIRNGCTQEPMSQQGLQGSYEQDGRRLTFIIARTDGETFRHDGSVSASSIVFRSVDEVLEFAR